MSLPRLSAASSALLLTVCLISACAQLSSSLQAQDVPPAPTPQSAPAAALPQAVHLQDYSKPRSAFPHILQPYQAQEVAQPNMGNSAAYRLDDARWQDLSVD